MKHKVQASGYSRRKNMYGTDKPRKPKHSYGGAPDIHKVSRDMDGVRANLGNMKHNSSHGY